MEGLRGGEAGEVVQSPRGETSDESLGAADHHVLLTNTQSTRPRHFQLHPLLQQSLVVDETQQARLCYGVNVLLLDKYGWLMSARFTQYLTMTPLPQTTSRKLLFLCSASIADLPCRGTVPLMLDLELSRYQNFKCLNMLNTILGKLHHVYRPIASHHKVRAVLGEADGADIE